jgi:hypothetical protein
MVYCPFKFFARKQFSRIRAAKQQVVAADSRGPAIRQKMHRLQPTNARLQGSKAPSNSGSPPNIVVAVAGVNPLPVTAISFHSHRLSIFLSPPPRPPPSRSPDCVSPTPELPHLPTLTCVVQIPPPLLQPVHANPSASIAGLCRRLPLATLFLDLECSLLPGLALGGCPLPVPTSRLGRTRSRAAFATRLYQPALRRTPPAAALPVARRSPQPPTCLA